METIHSRQARSEPLNSLDREAITLQLERMVADPLFKNSRRFPRLLRYVVEHTILEGTSAELKERTLGVEVFGRQPNYDTNEDPIVRTTAGEIRKRIAQYYQEPQHAGEIRIHLFPGSYVPVFEMPEASVLPPPAAHAPAGSLPPKWFIRYWPVLSALAVMIVIAAVVVLKPWKISTALDQFWAPVLSSSETVLLCIGQKSFMAFSQEPGKPPNLDIARLTMLRSPDAPITIYEMYYLGSQNVVLDDAKTLARLSGLLQSKGKNYRVIGESSASFADLRGGPVVLIGAFNNDWTLRLSGPMRFTFERAGDTMRIHDRHAPSEDHMVSADTPYLKLSEDYALISRVQDPTTGRIVIIAAGLTGYGTMAAGEFLSDPSYMEAAAKQAPPHWQAKNLQLVLATNVINGNSGPPRVVGRYYW